MKLISSSPSSSSSSSSYQIFYLNVIKILKRSACGVVLYTGNTITLELDTVRVQNKIRAFRLKLSAFFLKADFQPAVKMNGYKHHMKKDHFQQFFLSHVA